MSDAREEILRRIRSALAADPSTKSVAALPVGPVGEPRPSPLPERRARFVERLESVSGQVHPVADVAEAARVLRELCLARGLGCALVSDGAGLRELLRASEVELEILAPDGERAQLFLADLGLTRAQAGIAETGTLVLLSTAETHRLASLVPGVHVALLAEEDLVDSLEEALALLGAGGAQPPPVVTLITGPSRTADIELTLVVGVHGPRELHVLLLRAQEA